MAISLTGVVTSSATAEPTPTGTTRTGPVEVQLLSFNDYHGHLERQTPGAIEVPEVGEVPAGGAEFLARHLNKLRRGNPNSLTVTVGDLICGSPFLSGLFHDEPSVESLNAMGLDVSGVGNHEFDEGVRELRMELNGEPIVLTETYLVTVNNFLADGGDGFEIFTKIDPGKRIGGGGPRRPARLLRRRGPALGSGHRPGERGPLDFLLPQWG